MVELVDEFGKHPDSPTKVRYIKDFQKTYQKPLFIETGTWIGNMVNAVRNDFQQIYSIELKKSVFENASKKFSPFPHVHIIYGDSSKVLPELLSTLSQPCLFWLDAHYSGEKTAKGDLECPILGELEAIQKYPIKDNIILIDDARLFIGKNDWPPLNEILSLLRKIDPKYKIEVKDDIIRAYIPKSHFHSKILGQG